MWCNRRMLRAKSTNRISTNEEIWNKTGGKRLLWKIITKKGDQLLRQVVMHNRLLMDTLKA